MQKSARFGIKYNRTKEDAIPGYGGYTDIWLLKRDGSAAWNLPTCPIIMTTASFTAPFHRMENYLDGRSACKLQTRWT